jgi:hypothetical protein
MPQLASGHDLNPAWILAMFQQYQHRHAARPAPMEKATIATATIILRTVTRTWGSLIAGPLSQAIDSPIDAQEGIRL